MAKLIRELVTETTHSLDPVSKSMYLSGPVVMTEHKNQNGRIYRLPTMQREIARYINEEMANCSSYGESKHPESPEMDMDRVAILWTECVQDGNNFVGKAKLIPNAHGSNIKTIIEAGGRVGFSTRGLGSIIKEGADSIVGDDYHLVTLGDVVLNPSAVKCLATAIVEATEWVFENGHYSQKNIDNMVQLKEAVLSAPSRKIDTVMMAECLKFINSISSKR